MTKDKEGKIRDIIDSAEVVDDPIEDEDAPRKPRLRIEPADPDTTVAALRDVLAAADGLYDRGVPVRLARDQFLGGMVAQVVTPEILVMMAHRVCRPYARKVRHDGSIDERDVRLPRHVAVTYLDWHGAWQLPPLNGIASAPILADDGSIQLEAGYSNATGMWCENLPDLTGLVPEQPTFDDARIAFLTLRRAFWTFCFADAETGFVPDEDGLVVDLSRPPGYDESGFLAAILTAVCRPSLHLAPGILLHAAPLSGAGAGKGLLARCISIIAYGREPHAVTGGTGNEELEKRIAAELIEGSPVLFLDNLNNRAFRSDLLASAITERPARVRILGRSQMVPLNASALVILTGNGLRVSEDLARRFIAVELDPRTEDPEARRFRTDAKAVVTAKRAELLAAALTIWRWGRQHQALPAGRALGSFEQWCRWVRDPLLVLGCRDPAERVGEAKERDNQRQATAEIFQRWWACHADHAVPIRGLAEEVVQLVDPQGRGRQFVAAKLEQMAGTRIAGFLLTRQLAAGKWGAATYALEKTDGAEGHRGHRGHGAANQPAAHSHSADTPYAPYADAGSEGGTAPGTAADPALPRADGTPDTAPAETAQPAWSTLI
ncbi:MAG: hypothetical protein RIC87_08150 [Kiloniellales bacterium]